MTDSNTFLFMHAGTSAHPRPDGMEANFPHGAIGIAIVDGDLCICISPRGGADTVAARLNGSLLDDFCGVLADQLDKIRPPDADGDPLPGETPCPALH
jgi:hypothetical protein